jgi:hypothetical protein
MIRRRKLLIAPLVASALAIGFNVTPAVAVPRTFVVTLLGGSTVTVTVDVPADMPVDQISFPDLQSPVVSVQEVGAPSTTPEATASPQTTSTEGAIPQAAPGAEQGTEIREATIDPEATGTPEAEADAPPEEGRNPDGSPTIENPTFSLALPGAAPIGVPNFFIDKFRIPPFLLPIYQAAGIQYGVRWEVLAAINEIETDYGRNLNVSSAGAVGWMQFLPSSWKTYGVDANEDGVEDPYNPADAIFGAARYLKAAGADTDLRRAIFAYNHADWYVDSVMLRARVLGGLPSNFVGSLTGLTQGHFPVAARATYAAGEKGDTIDVFARNGAPVIAINDGRVVSVTESGVVLEDVFGNTYTYSGLGKVAERYPAPREQAVTPQEIAREMELPKPDAPPTQPATAGEATAPSPTPGASKERLFANPPEPVRSVSTATFRSAVSRVFGVKTKTKDVTLETLEPGSRVIAGTVLGRVGDLGDGTAPHLTFAIRPAGRGAPQIDPKPILDGWKLLESTALYRAAGENPFADGEAPSIGQILLMDKTQLQRLVLADPRIEIYGCGRDDVKLGQIDRRVLATLEFLSLSGFRPTVTSLKCGHSFRTASGNVSEHSSGNAVDIAKINGIPVLGNQGKGSITDIAVQRLLTLQGLMKPHQIITLMRFAGSDNTFAMADHDDHIHVGFQPLYGTNTRASKRVNAILEPKQWIDLVDRLNEIDQPVVRTTPSKAALKTNDD